LLLTATGTFLGTPGEGYSLRNYTYLQLAFGTILARIIIAFIFIKPYYDYNVYSIYEFLTVRFGTGSKNAASAVFLVTRVLATLNQRAPTHDPAYGYGSLAVGRAIRAAVPPNAANPVYDALTPFLDREQARAAAASSEPAPQPAATTNAPPGRFEEGAEPGTFTGPVLAGTVAALVGIAILAMLGGMALASRRERPSPIPVAPPPAWPTDSTGGSPPEWQDITGPIWPFAPPPDRRIG
jgi:hypothetical protein